MANWAEYQKGVERTANKTLEHNRALANWLMGACDEFGELFEVVKKHLFHGHELNMDKVISEAGDCHWYVGQLATEHGINVDDLIRTTEDNLPAGVKVESMWSSPIFEGLTFPREQKLEILHHAGMLYLAKLAEYHLGNFYGVGSGCFESDKDVLNTYLYAYVRLLEELCIVLGIDQQDVMQKNLDKLKARYPEKFSTLLSINRTPDTIEFVSDVAAKNGISLS